MQPGLIYDWNNIPGPEVKPRVRFSSTTSHCATVCSRRRSAILLFPRRLKSFT